MTCKGTVKNGVIVLEQGVVLPDGATVEIIAEPQPGLSEEVMKFAGTLPGPKDFARNHDHYIHGTPRK